MLDGWLKFKNKKILAECSVTTQKQLAGRDWCNTYLYRFLIFAPYLLTYLLLYPYTNI